MIARTRMRGLLVGQGKIIVGNLKFLDIYQNTVCEKLCYH